MFLLKKFKNKNLKTLRTCNNWGKNRNTELRQRSSDLDFPDFLQMGCT